MQRAEPSAGVMHFDPDCAMARVLDLVANKWTVPIIYVLSNTKEPVRFADLRRRIGITQKELTRHLRRLEAATLVTRTVHAEVPPRVEYALTDLGRTLVTPLVGLARWAWENRAIFEEDQEKIASE